MRIYQLTKSPYTTTNNQKQITHWHATLTPIEITPNTDTDTLIIIDTEHTTLTHQNTNHKIILIFGGDPTLDTTIRIITQCTKQP